LIILTTLGSKYIISVVFSSNLGITTNCFNQF
jgi:hypothetical protein